MSDHTPEERAARIKIDFTIGPETEKRLRAAIAHECRNAMQQERRRCYLIADDRQAYDEDCKDWSGAAAALSIKKSIGDGDVVVRSMEHAGPNGDAAGSILSGDARISLQPRTIQTRMPPGTYEAIFPKATIDREWFDSETCAYYMVSDGGALTYRLKRQTLSGKSAWTEAHVVDADRCAGVLLRRVMALTAKGG